MRSLAEHRASPHTRTLPEQGIDGCAGGSCGVIATIVLSLDDDGVIASAAYRVRGREIAMLAASALCEAAEGRTLVEAAALGLMTVHPDFATLSTEDRERALVVEDAFHDAIGKTVRSRMHSAQPVTTQRDAPLSAIVALSGGLDSTWVLDEHVRDDRVAGVTLRLWIDPQAPDPDSACCSPDAVRRARHACHARSVPHITLDLRTAFLERIVAPFVGEYSRGKTPNPCVSCNGTFRLDALVECADVLGAERIVTGHYARIVERGGRFYVQRGIDERKDQSYMLATTSSDTLARFDFPLGAATKSAVRAAAAERGLAEAMLRESQDVCFIGGGDHRDFLERANALGVAGNVRDVDGTVLGQHDGIARFTPGQRRGLGQYLHGGARTAGTGNGGERRYVSRVDAQSGTVWLGDVQHLSRLEVALTDLKVLAENVAGGEAVFRHRGPRTMVTLSDVDTAAATCTLECASPVRAPAPGQIACIYDADDVVIATGVIAHTEAASAAN